MLIQSLSHTSYEDNQKVKNQHFFCLKLDFHTKEFNHKQGK